MNKPLYAVVPAAGIGSRMQADRPKQYLTVQGKTILEHTLERLLRFKAIEKIILPISKDDDYLSQLSLQDNSKIQTCNGGSERYSSVLNGLKTLLDSGVADDAWVMVHDVARPCIRLQDLKNLYANANSQGLILGLPVRDTMKRTTGNNEIIKTVERDNLWHALTPQMAPLKILFDAISKAMADGINITDEASALEYSGYKPLMLAGHPSNIKVTHPEDLDMVNAFLKVIE